jgi:hypothetical protein
MASPRVQTPGPLQGGYFESVDSVAKVKSVALLVEGKRAAEGGKFILKLTFSGLLLQRR